MKLFEIKRNLQHAGYAEYVDVIESQAQRCVRFSLIPTDEREIAVGCTKAGGSPDLPLDYSWPTRANRPLDFILQLNLSDVSGFPHCKELPQEGLLSVFYDSVEQPWGYDPKHRCLWKILYIREPQRSLKRLALPEAGLFRKLTSCAVTFHEALCPGWANIPVQALNLDEVQAKEFFSFVYSLPGEPSHQILGRANGIQSSEEEMKLQCQWVSNGLYCGGGGGPAFDEQRAKELEPGAAEWRLLLQLDSDENAGMEWGDRGQLYFWIREEDLQQRDFSDVWVILECW